MMLGRGLFLAATLCGSAAAAAPHVPVKWPVRYCDPREVTAASPVPATSNSDSLSRIPFTDSLVPFSAAVLVSLTDAYRPVIECVVKPEVETGFENLAVEVVADMVFSAPQAVNTVARGGRYLARVTTLLGHSWIDQPPAQPILPACKYVVPWFHRDYRPVDAAPRPAHRVHPRYPSRAEEEGIEGTVTIHLDIFSNGDAVPNCLVSASPPGWFEKAALDAVAQWRFAPDAKRGIYSVTVRFRLRD